MAFANQLFISYSHLDNDMTPEQKQGWVSKFHDTLAAYLNRRLGRKAAIWFDPTLSGNDDFSEEIVQQFPKTAVLVSIVSPRYVQSEWCTREAKEFCSKAVDSGGIRVGNKLRIFKVVLLPAPEDPLPDPMRLELGYPFYVLNERDVPLELDSDFGPDFAQKYNLKIANLAYDIAELIKDIEKPAPEPAGTVSTKPIVYLAETGYDRREAREALLTDLKLHGYQVLPDAKLPADESAYLAEVQRVLARCRLSIHLIGGEYAAGPDGQSKNFVTLQNQAASARSAEAPLPRLIWLPEGTRSDAPEQQQFIDSLLKDPQQQVGADLIAATLESFKSAVHAALEKIEAAPVRDAAKPRVYVAECSYDRREERQALIAYLRQSGYEVLPDATLPLDEDAYIGEVQKLLARCELAIHLVGAKYGKVPDGPSDKSAVVLQNELATARSNDASLSRIIWLPEGTQPTSPLEQQFVESLRSDPNQRAGAELITGDLGILQAAALAAIERIEDAAAAAAARATAEALAAATAAASKVTADEAARIAASAAAAAPAVSSAPVVPTGPKLIYVICDKEDGDATDSVRMALSERDMDSETPSFEGDAGDLRKLHEDLLSRCDAVLLFYGKGSKAWRQSMEMDLRKLPEYRGGKALPVQYTFLAAPNTPDNEKDKADLIKFKKPKVINGLGEFSETLLDPLLKELTGAGA